MNGRCDFVSLAGTICEEPTRMTLGDREFCARHGAHRAAGNARTASDETPLVAFDGPPCAICGGTRWLEVFGTVRCRRGGHVREAAA